MNKETTRKIPALKEILGPTAGELDPDLDDSHMREWAQRQDRNAHLLLTAWRTLLETEAAELEPKRA
jgi:hypothetical protein